MTILNLKILIILNLVFYSILYYRITLVREALNNLYSYIKEDNYG